MAKIIFIPNKESMTAFLKLLLLNFFFFFVDVLLFFCFHLFILYSLFLFLTSRVSLGWCDLYSLYSNIMCWYLCICDSTCMWWMQSYLLFIVLICLDFGFDHSSTSTTALTSKPLDHHLQLVCFIFGVLHKNMKTRENPNM